MSEFEGSIAYQIIIEAFKKKYTRGWQFLCDIGEIGESEAFFYLVKGQMKEWYLVKRLVSVVDWHCDYFIRLLKESEESTKQVLSELKAFCLRDYENYEKKGLT